MNMIEPTSYHILMKRTTFKATIFI
uniref:Uncharacterized protein n=1 Tax=Rhizophora mucronata TaxID=61149 RepID=A0A2P2P681_RHIMU